MDDQVIRLTLETKGQETLDNLRKSTENYRALLGELVNQFARGETTAEEFERQQKQLSRELEAQSKLLGQLESAYAAQQKATAASAASTYDLADAEKTLAASTADVGAAFRQAEPYLTAADAEFDRLLNDAVENTRAQRALAGALDATASAQRTLTTSTAAVGTAAGSSARNWIMFGQSVQDFQAAGLLGISNNLDQMVMAIGGPAGLAAAVTIAGAAFLAAKPYIEGFTEGLLEVGIEVPKSSDALKNLEADLKATEKALEAYADRTKLSLPELVEFNRLTAEQARLEKEKADALAKQKELEGLNALQPEAQTKRAAGFRKAVGEAGGGERAMEMVTQALENVARVTGQDVPQEVIARQAEDMIRAASKGDLDARNQVTRLLNNPAFSPQFDGRGRPTAMAQFGQNVVDFAPETVEAKKEAEKAEKKAEAQRKKDEAAGEAIQQQADAELARQQREAARKAKAAEDDQAERAANLAAAPGMMAEIFAKWDRRIAQQQGRPAADAQSLAFSGSLVQQGATNDQATAAAKRAVELQQQGFGVQQAQAVATQELMLTVNGLWGELGQLRAFINMQTQQARQMRSKLNRWPG